MKSYDDLTDKDKEIIKFLNERFMENIQNDLPNLKKAYEEDLALHYNRAIYGSEYPNLSDKTLDALLKQNKYLNGRSHSFVDNEIV